VAPEPTETSAKAEQPAKTENVHHRDTETQRRTEKAEQAAQAEKTDKLGKAEKTESVEKPESIEKAEKIEKPDKMALPEPGMAQQAGRAAEAGAKEKVPEGLISVEALVNPPPEPEEKPLHDLLVNTIKTPGGEGAQAALKGKTSADISVRVAAVMALERNLPLQISAHDTEILKHALDEAWAAFLPLFSMSGGFSNTTTNRRVDELTPWQKISSLNFVKGYAPLPGGPSLNPSKPSVLELDFLVPQGGAGNVAQQKIVFVKPGDNAHYYVVQPVTVTANGQTSSAYEIIMYPSSTPPPPVNNPQGIVQTVNNQPVMSAKDVSNFFNTNKLQVGYVDPTFQAKSLPLAWNYNIASMKTAEDTTDTFTFSIFQQLPWGPQINLSTSPVYHKLYYNHYDDSFGRDWFSNVSGSLYIPLPGTKNFGPYAPQDAAIKVAEQQREASLWDFRTAINNTLVQVDALYLGLVNTAMNVDAAINNRKTIEALQKQTDELLTANRTTQFGKSQVDSELQRVRVSEEAAWNAYIAASDALVELLNMDPNTLLVPVAYSKALNERMAYEAANAAAVGLENRPELKSAAVATKIARINVKFARQQARPDVSVTGNVTLSQTQTANGPDFRGAGGIGYSSIVDSLSNAFRRDVQDESYSATYTRSLFHRGENARIAEAEIGLDKQKLDVRIVENRVKNDVYDALAQLDSAKAAVEAAKTHQENARKAYELTAQAQKDGRITEFEVISKSQDLYSAEYAVNAVLAGYKQAETQLLYAQGVLAARYPERTAPNEFDKYRLGLLRASNALQFFGEGKEKKAP